MDDLAGLARVAIAQGQTRQAREQVNEILAWLDTNGASGIEYPLQVYLTCYQVLRATTDGDPAAMERAQAILTTAYNTLMEQTDRVRDPALRQSFLEGIQANREIVVAWKG